MKLIAFLTTWMAAVFLATTPALAITNADCGGTRGYASICAADGKVMPSQTRDAQISIVGGSLAGTGTTTAATTFTATGTGTASTTASDTATYSNSIVFSPGFPFERTALVSVTVTGTTTGTRSSSDTASTTLVTTSTAISSLTHTATATATGSFTGAGSGTGTVTITATATSSATYRLTYLATFTGTHSYTQSTTNTGTSIATETIVGSTVTGTATGTVTLTAATGTGTGTGTKTGTVSTTATGTTTSVFANPTITVTSTVADVPGGDRFLIGGSSACERGDAIEFDKYISCGDITGISPTVGVPAHVFNSSTGNLPMVQGAGAPPVRRWVSAGTVHYYVWAKTTSAAELKIFLMTCDYSLGSAETSVVPTTTIPISGSSWTLYTATAVITDGVLIAASKTLCLAVVAHTASGTPSIDVAANGPSGETMRVNGPWILPQ